MRKITTLIAALLMAVATFAQAPQGFSYQAVVRDAQNAIVANQTVDVNVTILQGAAFESAKAVFSEKHSAKTNANGLFTITIGSVNTSDFAKIDWGKGSCFLKTESAYGESTTQLMSVPYALYAANAGTVDKATIEQFVSNIDFTTYNLVNKTSLAQYAKSADVTNTVNNALASYTTNQKLNDTLAVYAKIENLPEGVNLTGYAKTADVDATYAKKTDLNAKANTADLADVATSGDYNDLTNKPTIPTVPTNVSAFTNDAAYVTLTQLQEQLAALQTEIERLQAFAPKFKKLKIQIVNPYAGNSSTWGYNTATVQFDGVSFTSGTKEFDVQVGSAMPLSVSLGTFKQTETNYYPYEYTYTVTVNGQPFDNVAGTYDRPTGYVYNTMRTVSLTELVAKGMIEGGNEKLSDNQIGYSEWHGHEDEYADAEEMDTYFNRTAQQDQFYIYADIVDAIPDYDKKDYQPYNAQFGGSIYNDFDKKTYYCEDENRSNNKYFENRLLLSVTQEDGHMTEALRGEHGVGIAKKGYYWSSNSWTNDEGVSALGLTHSSHYNDSYLGYAPIFAKIPNFVYKMEYEQGEIYKVGTRKDELNGNMNGQNVGPFVDGENTIVITVKRVGGGQVHN